MRTSSLLLWLALAGVLGSPLVRAEAEQVGKLTAVLRSEAPLHEKQAACRELAVAGAAEAVPALAALLGDEKLAHAARNALEAIPDPAAGDALRETLGKLKGGLLVGVVNSLGVRRDAKAAEPLAKLLADADVDVAAAAATALGRIGTPEAAGALEAALPGATPALLPAVCEGCLRCAEAAWAQGRRDAAVVLYDRVRASQAPRHVRMGALRGAILARGPAGLPLLLEQLRGDDVGFFMLALRVAHELPGTEATQALAAELAKLPAERQDLLLQVLGSRGDVSAVPAVRAAAENGPDPVRVAAIRALTRLGDASALLPLVELATSGTGEVARAAQAAVASFPAKEADATIASLLSAADAKKRGIAVALIGQRRIASAVPSLLKVAADADEQVRVASLKVLGDLAGAAELPGLLDLLVKAKSPQEMQAAESAASAVCLRQTDRDSCAEKVSATLANAQPGAKPALLRVMRSVGGAKALAAVRAAATDADAEVKGEALRVLCDWPTVDALSDLAEMAKNSADAKLKILALRGYIRLIPKQDAPAEKKLAALKEALALVQRDDEKKLVLAALAEVPHSEAARLIEPYLGDAAVKAEAESALLKCCQLMAGASPEDVKTALSKLVASTANPGLKKQAQDLLRQMEKSGDYVTAWQVTGAYAQDGKDGLALFDVAFPPEKPDAKDVQWTLLPPAAERGGAMMLDLAAACGAGENKLAYVRTWIHSDKEQPARLEFGTDDGNKVWLNGALVHGNPNGGAATPGKFKADVTLKPGFNTLRMKVTQFTGPWEFCFRICKPDGGKLEGLKVQATPPAEGAVVEVQREEVRKEEPPKAEIRHEEFPKDAVSIFNGKDLTDWDSAPGWWSVEDGALTAQSTPEKPCKQCNYLIWKGGKPSDFDLSADFRLSAAGNSGIQIRSETRPNWDTFGYQADMTGDGGLVGFVYHHKRGLIAGRGEDVTIGADGKKEVRKIGDPAELLKAFKKEDWNTYRVICRGPEIALYVNGVLMCRFTDKDAAQAAAGGIIAFQMHPGPPMKVQFKNVRLKELK